MRWVLPLAAGVVLAGAATSAGAVNGLRPRMTPDFGEVPCLTRIDRSAGAVFHVEYSIAEEDLELDPVDVATGRTHQFLAVGHHVEGYLPVWITWADVDEAAAKDLIKPEGLTDDDVFETSSLWPADSWIRITPDSPRIPISFDAAAMGVDWDTTTAAAGPWRIMGYTWDPEVNVDTIRDGLVMVVDGDDPSTYPPGVHVLIPPASNMVFEGDDLVLDACIDAMPGSTVELAWAEPIPGGGATWTVVEPELVGFTSRGDFQLRVPVPYDLGDPNDAPWFQVRLTVTDPMGRSHVAYSMNEFSVIDNGDPPGTGSTDGGTDGGTDTDGTSAGGNGGSCACGIAGAPPPGLVLLVLLALPRKRQR